MARLTLDTGALIALSRRRQRVREVVNLAFIDDITVTVPAAVVAEWWRERSDESTTLLKSLTVEPLNHELGVCRRRSDGRRSWLHGRRRHRDGLAAQRGDVVLRSDDDDLAALQRVFPSVRVLAI